MLINFSKVSRSASETKSFYFSAHGRPLHLCTETCNCLGLKIYEADQVDHLVNSTLKNLVIIFYTIRAALKTQVGV